MKSPDKPPMYKCTGPKVFFEPKDRECGKNERCYAEKKMCLCFSICLVHRLLTITKRERVTKTAWNE